MFLFPFFFLISEPNFFSTTLSTLSTSWLSLPCCQPAKSAKIDLMPIISIRLTNVETGITSNSYRQLRRSSDNKMELAKIKWNHSISTLPPPLLRSPTTLHIRRKSLLDIQQQIGPNGFGLLETKLNYFQILTSNCSFLLNHPSVFTAPLID